MAQTANACHTFSHRRCSSHRTRSLSDRITVSLSTPAELQLLLLASPVPLGSTPVARMIVPSASKNRPSCSYASLSPLLLTLYNTQMQTSLVNHSNVDDVLQTPMPNHCSAQESPIFQSDPSHLQCSPVQQKMHTPVLSQRAQQYAHVTTNPVKLSFRGQLTCLELCGSVRASLAARYTIHSSTASPKVESPMSTSTNCRPEQTPGSFSPPCRCVSTPPPGVPR
jgi:hypothetical protein